MTGHGLERVGRAVLAMAASVALINLAAAQDTRLSVHDLVLPDRIPATSARDGFVGPMISNDAHVWGVVRNLIGEQSLRAPQPKTLFRPDELSSIVGILMGSQAYPTIEDGWLLVSQPEATRAAVAVNLVRRHVRSQEVEIDLRLESVEEGENEVLLQGTKHATAGETVVLSDVVSRRALIEFDVEIAQASVIANPRIGEVSGGTSIALRTRPVPRSDLAVVEAVVRVGDVDVSEPIDLGHSVMRYVHRFSSGGGECGISFLARRGTPTVHEWTSWDGRLLRLTCVPSWADLPTNPETKALVLSPLLRMPILDFGWRWFDPDSGDHDDQEAPDELRAAIDSWISSRREHVLVDARDGDARCGAILFGGEAAQDDEQGLANLIRGSLIGSELSVLVLDCPAGQGIDASAPLPQGVRLIGRAKGPVLAGKSVCFAGSLQRSFVRDWNAEVAQSARIVDPQTGLCEAGYWISALLTTSPSDQMSTIALDCEVSTCDLSASTETLMGSQMISPERLNAQSSGGGRAIPNRTPAVLLPEERVRIELPVVRSHRIGTSRQLARGSDMVLRQAAPNLLGDGRELVVVVGLK